MVGWPRNAVDFVAIDCALLLLAEKPHQQPAGEHDKLLGVEYELRTGYLDPFSLTEIDELSCRQFFSQVFGAIELDCYQPQPAHGWIAHAQDFLAVTFD